MENPHGHGPSSEYVAARAARSSWWIYYGSILDHGIEAVFEQEDGVIVDEDIPELARPARHVFIDHNAAEDQPLTEWTELVDSILDMTQDVFDRLRAEGRILPLRGPLHPTAP